MKTYIQREIAKGELPKEREVVFAIDKGRKVLCEYSEGKFYRSTDNSGNDRLLRFYYPDITHWLEEIPIPQTDELPSDYEIELKFPSEYLEDGTYLENINKQEGAKWMKQLAQQLLLRKDKEIKNLTELIKQYATRNS